MLSRLGWSLWAWLVSLSMRPGVRYGWRSYRWHMLRAAILERDGHACRGCGRVAAYGGTWIEVHHRRRVADGGGMGRGIWSPSAAPATNRPTPVSLYNSDYTE